LIGSADGTIRPRAQGRAVAVSIPVKNEEGRLRACLDAIDTAASRHRGRVTIVAMVSDCDDSSLAILAAWRPVHATLDRRAV
jgi:hypothetical protein